MYELCRRAMENSNRRRGILFMNFGDPIVYSDDCAEKLIALTLDDGPHRHITPHVILPTLWQRCYSKQWFATKMLCSYFKARF
jgi:hypothetical protein